MIIVDASIVSAALLVNDPQGVALRELLAARELGAPEFIDLEVISSYRKQCRSGKLDEAVADLALERLSRLRAVPTPGGP